MLKWCGTTPTQQFCCATVFILTLGMDKPYEEEDESILLEQ